MYKENKPRLTERKKFFSNVASGKHGLSTLNYFGVHKNEQKHQNLK